MNSMHSKAFAVALVAAAGAALSYTAPAAAGELEYKAWAAACNKLCVAEQQTCVGTAKNLSREAAVTKIKACDEKASKGKAACDVAPSIRSGQTNTRPAPTACATPN